MLSVPLAAYDVLGYLSAGAALAAGLGYILGFPTFFGRDLTPVETGGAVLAMYVAGQFIATPSQAILEAWFVHRIVGAPSEVLFRSRHSRWRYVFPGYHRGLPHPIADRVRERALMFGVTRPGQAMFSLARHSEMVTSDAQAMERIATFLAQYGFARNLAFVAIALAPALLLKARWYHEPNAAYIGVASLLVGIVFVYRFLKFYRAYSLAVFHRFGAVTHADASSLH